jgi:hypothetical protein
MSMLSRFDMNDLKSAYSTDSGDSSYSDTFAVGISMRYSDKNFNDPFRLNESIDHDIMNILFGSSYSKNLIDESDPEDG